MDPTVLPEAFRTAVAQMRAARLRPEIFCEEMPAPQRIAPFASALSADVTVDGEDVGTGRLVLLHDPAGNDAWDGTFRCVAYARAEIDPEMANDPLLGEVGWSWLSEALAAHHADYTAPSGTVTKVSSESFGSMSDEDASAQLDPLTNGAIVTFQLDRAGGRKFGEETGRHIGDYMAILLDGRVQGRPPVIQSRIGRNGQITLGNKTLQEAQDLALTLKAGALPIPLKIVEERQVGASLGSDSIRDGITAGIVGTAMVILIMLVYYRMSGALAVLALALYILFTLGGLSMVNATLTLPGLAGIVLSVGIAVDANVLIFERIREELIEGRTVHKAVDEGFRHAMNAIVDSNVSTVLTALFLFEFGTGPVKGFAVTLIMGIIASMITAIFVTRTFFMIWLQRRPAMSTLSI